MLRRSAMVSAAELRELSQAPAWMTVLPLIACYLTVAVAVAIAVAERFDRLELDLLASVVVVSRTHAIAVLMHEFAHDHVFQSRRRNLLGGELASLILPFSMSRHRATHLLHHRFTSTERDPDWLQFARTPFAPLVASTRPRAVLVAHHLLVVSGLAGIGVILSDIWLAAQNVLGGAPFFAMTMAVAKDGNGRWDASAARLLHVPRWADALTLAVVAAMSILMIVFHLHREFLFYYFIPNFMLLPFIAYVRVEAEHWGHFGESRLPTRTVKRSVLGNLLLSPYNINFHAEHHLFPQVPWMHLQRLHERLCRHPEYGQAAVIHGSHLEAVLRNFGCKWERPPHRAPGQRVSDPSDRGAEASGSAA